MLVAHLVAVVAGLALWLAWFDPWYRSIELPTWSPPDGLIRWGWAAGLVLSGVGFWLIHDRTAALTGLAVILLWSQVALAIGWAAVFIRAHRARSGFYLICMQWTAAALAAAAAASLSPTAGIVLLPWLGFIAYVGAFNFFVWQLEHER